MTENTPENPGTVVSGRDRHLKWKALDTIERALMWLSGLLLATFSVTVLLDVVTRSIGRPINSLQEITLGAFVWGIFIGGSAAVRRNEHFQLAAAAQSLKGTKRALMETFNHLVVLGVCLFLAFFGYFNFLQGFGNFLQPSGTPVAVITAAIPVAGVVMALFTVERLVNGWRNGFEEETDEKLNQELNVVEGRVNVE
jgi:TRAP-type C4-dicarboxylate transport system permease small subunit